MRNRRGVIYSLQEKKKGGGEVSELSLRNGQKIMLSGGNGEDTENRGNRARGWAAALVLCLTNGSPSYILLYRIYF